MLNVNRYRVRTINEAFIEKSYIEIYKRLVLITVLQMLCYTQNILRVVLTSFDSYSY